MSLCLDSNNVLANQVSTASAIQIPENATILTTSTTPISSPIELNDTQQQQQLLHKKPVTKLLVSNHSVIGNVSPVLQKISNPPVITVLNSAGGPLTVLKTICVTSGVSSTPHFSLVNNQSLTVTNAVGKTPTITLLNTPVTVVKMTPPHPQNIENKPLDNANCPVSTQNVSTIIENRAHNVFVKNTCSDSSVSDLSQGHKFSTANNFSQTNVLTSIPTTSGKAVNNQRGKLKILSNVMVPPSMSSSSNIQQTTNQVVTKPNSQSQQQRIVPRQKVLGPNGSQPKYINKLQNTNMPKSICSLKQNTEKAQQQAKVMYPTHKSQIKTLPPVNNYVPKPGMKSLNSQQPKNIPAQVQRTGSGLRTIPPQRPPKLPNKLNYIGKHAVQAQKVKAGQSRFHKPLKQVGPPFYNACGPPPHANKQSAFNQALTAEILETLGNKTGGPTTSYQSKGYEILPNKYTTPYEEQTSELMKYEEKPKTNSDTLSLICQAVLLDHNYNATLPPDSPTRSAPLSNNSLQANGMSSNSMSIYSPGSSAKTKYPPERKRTPSCSNPVSTSSSMTNISSSLPSNSTSLVNLQDDDAASDISDCSDRKHDTEGEETDTAPEAEAVTNEEPYDHYGDYVTRCICGFQHDDGYMVECDECKVWQHVQCVVKNKQVPDEYLCEKCNPSKPVDPHKARSIQQQWLRERQLPEMKNFKKDAKLKENPKIKEILTDSDSSDAENPRNNNTVITKGRTPLAQRKKSDKQLTKHKKESKESNIQRKSFKKRERKLIRRKSKLQSKKEEDENRDSVIMTQSPQLRQWIENYEEAVTNHYSPELRARISNIRVNGSQNIDTCVPFDPAVNKCRVHTLPLTDLKYSVATVDISPDSSIIESRGKYMLSIQHRSPGANSNTRQHAQRPGPFLFFYRLNKDNTEVCVDTRTYGNVARFVRRSCKPNAELRHCIEKGVLHLFIVAISIIEKSAEITIKHESHDSAAIGTTQISCYCGNPGDCKLNKSTVKRNGESVSEMCRKKRGRRTVSVSTHSESESTPVSVKEEAAVCEALPPVVPTPAPRSPSPVKIKIEKMEEESKEEIKTEEIEIHEEILDIKDVKPELAAVKVERPLTPVDDSSALAESSETDDKEVIKKEEKENECKKSPGSVSTRRSSQHKGEKEKDDDKPVSKQEKSKNKKLSREERKSEAILRAIEQMEKANQRKQEHKQTKHVQRRESEPSPYSKEEEKTVDLKQKRKRRKGRARTTSTHSTRRDRLNSGDSYFTSGDENSLSPNDGMHPKKAEEPADDSTSGKHEGFLLTFSNNDEASKRDKSPIRENDSNSNSVHSSPETPSSSACSSVQAAVEPSEPGFKFPKTKKGMMNEWLNKTPESVQPSSSPLSLHINSAEVETNANSNTPTKIVSTESGPKGSAKKRWLRQAISEDKCDSPQESPPISDMVAPPKKRRSPRESISNDNTPPTTPTSVVPPENRMECDAGGPAQEPRSFHLLYEDCVDNQKEQLESDHILRERAAEMKQEFGTTLMQSVTTEISQRPDTSSFGCSMDPRLRNHSFANSEHSVGTVEKTSSILGFEERKPEVVQPIRRKSSITEYRQRKKLNNNEMGDKSDEAANAEEEIEENNSSESFQMACARPRSNSPSSSSSSSDDETSVITELPAKVPAFNSEPTELERQREMQSLRLKKAFGLSIDVEPKKPALTGESIFKSEITVPPLIKSFSVLDSPGYPAPSSGETSELNKSTVNSPRSHAILTQTDRPGSSPTVAEPEKECPVETIVPEVTPTLDEEQPEQVVVAPPSPVEEISEEKESPEIEETADFEAVPEEEVEVEKMEEEDVKPHMFYTPDEEEEIEEKEFAEVESVSYVPPFNNPIYPSVNYTSVIDEEGRYEGRNPSPPPSHLESEDMEN